MTYQQAKQLERILAETAVELRPVPRGFNTARGVPDSVIWIEPAALRFTHSFPILVELEKDLFNVDDFEKFARRDSAEEPYRHHITIGALDSSPAPMDVTLTYDVAAVGSQLVDNEPESFEEPHFHDALREWVDNYADSFDTDARTTLLRGTRIVWWQLSFPMYGHHFETEIPFVVEIGEAFHDVFRLYQSRIIIPAVAVITGEDFLDTQTEKYETTLQFRQLSTRQLEDAAMVD